MPGETVATYVAERRRIACYCDFGGNLDISLRDRFVCGLKNEAVIKKLLQEKDLDLPKTIAIATATEISSRDAAELGKGSTAAGTVNNIRKQRPLPKTSSSPSRDNCFRCGHMGHTPQNCKCKDMDSLQCGKRGTMLELAPRRTTASRHGANTSEDRLSTGCQKHTPLRKKKTQCSTTLLPHLPE